jgi:hypothetical protein
MKTLAAFLSCMILLFCMAAPARADSIGYSNGPVNGQKAAWSISGTSQVSNSFTLTSHQGLINRITGFAFWGWVPHGDTPKSVTWSFTSQPNGGIVYASGTANVLLYFVYTNRSGFDVYRIDTPPAPTINLPPGNYWLNLSNGTTTQGNTVAWDENDGVGCDSRGCPSTAYQNSRQIGSETFIIWYLCPHCIA